jgi:hypothetical protein
MHVHLDYEKAREIVYLAVRRAAAFLGYGLNAARDETLKDFTLSKEVEMHFLPKEMTEAQIAGHKRNFEQWVVINGFRELIEGFSVYLDQLYDYSLVASKCGQKIGSDYHGRIKRVRNKGLPGKQKCLSVEFGIVSNEAANLASLYKVRNCLAHNRGVVYKENYNEPEALVARWTAIELVLIKEDGTRQPIDFKRDFPPVEGPGLLDKQVVARVRHFKAGLASINWTPIQAALLVFSFG